MKIHPAADVQSKQIGKGTVIWQFSIVLPKAIIGSNCNINAHCFIENNVVIGNNVTIKCGVYIWNGITIEDNVFIGPNATFINDFLPRSKKYPADFLTTIIKKGASIGANCTIAGGIEISKYSMIGAGSVVTKNIPGNTLWYGNPAKLQGYVCNCGEKLNKYFVCSNCKNEYMLKDGSIYQKK